MAKVESDILFNDRLCYRMTLNDDDFGYVKYVLKDKESLYSLANQKKISEFCKEIGLTRSTFYRYINPDGKIRPHGDKLLKS